MLRYTMLRYVMLRYAMLCYVMLWCVDATLRYVMLRYATLCCTTPCFTTAPLMLRYVMLCIGVVCYVIYDVIPDKGQVCQRRAKLRQVMSSVAQLEDKLRIHEPQRLPVNEVVT